MNLPHLVAADVRRLILMRSAECRLRNVPVQGPNVRPNSWRSKLSMNLPNLVGADVRRLTSIFDCRFSNAECRMPNVSGSWPQCASESRGSRLPMKCLEQRSFSWLLAAGLCLAAWLPGCAIGPNYRRPAVDAPGNYRFAASQETNSLADLTWWEIFKEPVLQELVRVVEYRHY